MKKACLVLLVLFSINTLMASERFFRVDKTAAITNGYAIAWGVPGKKLDFERLDTLSIDELEKELNFSDIRNFVVDLQTNKILTTIQNEDMVEFTLGDSHYGNHYHLSLSKLSILDQGYEMESLAVVENNKWTSSLSNILLINTSNNKLETTQFDGFELQKQILEKLKLSILDKNIRLFEEGAVYFMENETEYVENVGYVNKIKFDFSIPKSDENSLEVKVAVKLKIIDGKLTPFILKVEQRQY